MFMLRDNHCLQYGQEFLFGSSFFLQYNDEYPRDNSQEMYKLTFRWKEITINN